MLRLLLALWLLVFCGNATLEADPVQVVLSFEQTPRVGMPVWVRLDLKEGTTSNYVPVNVRYPFNEQPWLFGFCNQFEIEKDGKPVPEIGSFVGHVNFVGPAGYLGLPTSPLGRIPLHLWYRFSEPGKYRVRYASVDHGSLHPKGVLAVSEWTEFELKPSDEALRSEWLKEKLANPPQHRQLLLGDHLPSLLSCPDIRTLPTILDYCYASDRFVQGYAVYSLYYFDDVLQRTEINSLIKKRGTSDLLAYYLSWRHDLFQPVAADLVDSLIPFLRSKSADEVGGALRALGFVRAHYSWETKSKVRQRMDSAVLAAASHILKFNEPTALLPFCTYLGQIKTRRSGDNLWKLCDRKGVSQQAWICLTWIGDPRGLPYAKSKLLHATDSDIYLPQQVHGQYTTNAVPVLLQALRKAASQRIRVACAVELATENSVEALLFLRNIVATNKEQEAVAVKGVAERFLPGKEATREDVVKLLNAKITAAETSHERRSREK